LGPYSQVQPDPSINVVCFYQCGAPRVTGSVTALIGETPWTEVEFTVVNGGESSQESVSHVGLYVDLPISPNSATTPLVVEDIPPIPVGQSVTRRTRLPGGTFEVPPSNPPVH